METFLLTANIIVVIAAIWFSHKHEKFPDKPESGPFRIKKSSDETTENLNADKSKSFTSKP